MVIKARIILAWCLLGATMIGWPLSQLTIAKHEPPFILGLSWMAILVTSIDVLSTQDVRKHEEQNK